MSTMGYYAPTNVFFGEGVEDKAGEVLKEYGAEKVLLHFGSGSVIKSGLLARVEKKLDEAGIAYVELGGVSVARRGIGDLGVRLLFCHSETVENLGVPHLPLYGHLRLWRWLGAGRGQRGHYRNFRRGGNPYH